MFIERLLNDGNAPVLEASVRFAAARHRLLAANIANVDTPGYIQKDLSPTKFQKMLSARMDRRDESPPGTVGFDDINGEVEDVNGGILFHDGNNRSMEQLMSDSAKNALFHNMMVELLRGEFSDIEMAAKGQPG